MGDRELLTEAYKIIRHVWSTGQIPHQPTNEFLNKMEGTDIAIEDYPFDVKTKGKKPKTTFGRNVNGFVDRSIVIEQ